MPAGLVLAGGAGRRLGQPKATVAIGGTTLVELAVATLDPLCDEVLVVGRPEIPLPHLASRLVHDRAGPDCPLNALATGLAALDADEVVVLACDLPNAAPLVSRLLDAPPGQAVVAVDPDGRLQPLCARYSREPALRAADALLASGDHRALSLLDHVVVTRIEASAKELANINTRADLDAQVRSAP